MLEFNESSGGEEHDVEAIIANAYGQPSPQDSSPQQASPAAAPAPVSEFEFSHRGQQIKVKPDDPRFQQWLSKGYDYDTHISQVKQEREAFERQRKEWEQSWSPYKEIDEYARSNPEWWAHVDQQFQQRGAPQQPQVDPSVQAYLDQKLGPLMQDIPALKQYLHKAQTEELEKQQASEDAQLAQSIKSLQEKYSGLDFAAKDESGLSLEQRVLNHAMEHGFPTFRGAFLDYYSDHLEQQAEARGREAMMKEAEKRKKLGLLDDSSPASKSVTPFPAGKPRSWHDPSLSADAILREMGFNK